MPDHPYQHIQTLLSSADAEKIHEGLELVRQEVARSGAQAARSLFEMVATLFHFDMFDRPDLLPVLEEAASLVVGFGDWVIPELLRGLDEGDLKAQLAIGHALGQVGAEAIQPLIAEYQATENTARRVFILYALGKIKSPRIVEALPLALEALNAADLELRDTATRAVGKFAECVPIFSEAARQEMFEKLRHNLADSSPVVRAKAVRSLGKLAKFGHLVPEERILLKTILERLMGIDEQYAWDYAFIVRREAEEAYQYVNSAG
ncbi:MAG: HEAT repeat domain-containing protein [Anaerolineales bacterium]|nr:HEAT repeat domain-containing protein [Anaerolineales bacterium]MCX7754121.1 HEAT repeat domain-containing protein [Anaerolineales bacterium]MDW8278035.1 HEAT repeat domain-containing protein [Anaerolineales bacterium]